MLLLSSRNIYMLKWVDLGLHCKMIWIPANLCLLEIARGTQQFFMIPKIFFNVFAEEPSSSYNYGRTFFRELLSCHLTELLPQEIMEEGSFVVVNYISEGTFFHEFLRKNFFCEIARRRFFRS